MEILRFGKTLSDDEGTFFEYKDFSWRKSVKEFYDAYYAICTRKQMSPSNFDGAYKKAPKIPYVHYETIAELHDGMVETLRQFRLREIKPFDTLSSNPTDEDIERCRKAYAHDTDFNQYFTRLLQIDTALREYVRALDELIGAYNVRFGCFRRALRKATNASELKKSQKEATDKLLALLAPYIKRLKKLGALPSSWSYDIKNLPISDFHRATLKDSEVADFEKYWKRNELPLASVVSAPSRPMSKPAPAKPVVSKPSSPSPAKPSAPTKVHISRPSLWHRFDRWVTRVGERIKYKIDDISTWIMKACVWIYLALLVISVIIIWVEDGFFSAALTVFFLFFIIGLLSAIIETLVGILCLIIKYAAYIPLYLLRFIFYRGWTFVTFLLGGAGYLTYLILKANYIIS